MQDFRKLRVWQSAHRLRLDIYSATRTFPSDERFGLTAQVRRSASSICANIAECCGYRGGIDSARFIQMSLGSACESLDHLIAATDLGYLAKPDFERQCAALESVRRMLVALLDRMRSSGKPRAESPKPRARQQGLPVPRTAR